MDKKKSRYDLIDEEIQNYQTLNKSSYVPTEELFKIFQSNLNVPTSETLKERYISNKISQYLGRKKDKQNRRIFLSTNQGGFSNIEKERNSDVLEKVISQLEKRRAGLEKNISKVKARQFLIENQMTIDELLENKEAK